MTLFDCKAPLAIAATLLLGAVFTPEAKADDIVIDPRGVCPNVSAFTTEEDRALPTNAEIDRISDKFQIVRVANLELKQAVDLFESIQAPALEFADKVEVLTSSKVDPSLLLLKARAKGGLAEICGWADAENLVRNVDLVPLALLSLPGFQDEVAIDGATASRLNAQIVVRASRKEGALIAVPLFTAPDGSRDGGEFRYAQDTPISFFSVADVVEVSRDLATGERCEDVRENDCFLLLSGANEDNRQDLIGWVRGGDVELWPSTMSLYFREGQRNVPYYLTDCAAKKAIGLSCIGSSEGPSGTGSHQNVVGNNIPRFPIISPQRLEQNNEEIFLYEAVAALNVCRPGSGDNACRDATQTLIDVSRRQNAIESLNRVDIMFLIDATASMEVYFKPVVEASIAFARDVVRGGEVEARFGAAVFGDYLSSDGAPGSLSYETIASLGEVGDADVLLSLLNTRAIQKGIRDPHRDQVEAPYSALVRAITESETGWSDDAALRLVIWVGDTGNRDPGRSKTRHSEGFVEERVTPAVIKRAIDLSAKDGLTKVRIAGINVPSVDKRVRAANAEDYLNDYNALREVIPSLYKPLVANLNAGDARTQVLEALNDVLTSASNAAVCGREGEAKCSDIRETSTTSSGEPTNDYVAMQIGVDLAVELGLIGPNRIQGLKSDEIIAVERLFVVHDPNRPDFDFWLGVTPRELDQMVNSLGSLCNDLAYRDFGTPLRDSYVTVLETATRDRVDLDITPAEFLAKRLSVPKSAFSDMLEVEFRSLLETLSRNDRSADIFRERACKRAKMLGYVRSGVRVDLNDLVYEQGSVLPKPDAVLEQFRWDWVGEGGGNRYYFFPLDFLP